MGIPSHIGKAKKVVARTASVPRPAPPAVVHIEDTGLAPDIIEQLLLKTLYGAELVGAVAQELRSARSEPPSSRPEDGRATDPSVVEAPSSRICARRGFSTR